MSFEVYLQSFHQGELGGVSSQRVRDVFGAHLRETEAEYWQLAYDDVNTCDINLTVHPTDPGMVQELTVHRPCADERLWDALASILALGDIVLYFPGGRAPLVARSSVIEHLPSAMVEALGQPFVVTSGREILHEIRAV